MSNYNKREKEKIPSKTVEFYIDCVDCDEEITEGQYFPTEFTFVGKCSNGHIREVKGIDFL